MFPLLVIWPELSGDFLKQESGNKGFITGHSERSAKKTELCMQPGRGRGHILSPDEITIKEEVGKSAVLGSELGTVVGQARVPLTEKPSPPFTQTTFPALLFILESRHGKAGPSGL